MNCLFRASSYATAIISRTSQFIRISLYERYTSLEKRSFNVRFTLATFHARQYSTRKSSGSKSQLKKLDPNPVVKDEKDAFYVVRKGDIVGIYKCLKDCQAQVGSSICDPPVSVYKGYSMPTGTEDYLVSRGVKNALHTIKASDLKEDLFGMLVPCPFQQPHCSRDDKISKDVRNKSLQEELDPGAVPSCILEFDGASKGNPGPAGAGVVVRAQNGNLICSLREGLGKATCNAAEYRAIILGLRYALSKGYRSVHVQGDSKLVCMQVQGLWKIKNQNMSDLFEEAKRLIDKFHSFQISHVLRRLNSEADAQANLAINLADGQLEEELEK